MWELYKTGCTIFVSFLVFCVVFIVILMTVFAVVDSIRDKLKAKKEKRIGSCSYKQEGK